MQFFKKKNLIKNSFFAGLVVFFIVHHFVSYERKTLDRIVSQCLYPFLYGNRVVHTWYTNRIFQKKMQREAMERIHDLEIERDALREKMVLMESTLGYAQRTEAIRFFAQRYDMKKLRLCQVLLRRLSEAEQIFIIEGGSRHGIGIDMAVVHKGNLVGKIIQTNELYSTVLLVTDKRCQVSVYCLNTKTRGIFQGLNNSEKAQLHYVDRLSLMQDGDVVVSSGDGLIFPEGFCMGTITSIEPQGIHFLIDVKPSIYPLEIDYCYVVSKGELSVAEQNDLEN